MQLYEKFYPITSTPFQRDDKYLEIVPCDALKPYIRCFWGMRKRKWISSDVKNFGLVTPDTCADIIFKINYTKNKIENVFCGLDDTSFRNHDNNHMGDEIATFAIRFYPWSVVLFTEESMKGTKNRFFDVGVHFEKLKNALESRLFECSTMEEQISLAQGYLINHIYENHRNSLFLRAMAEIIVKKGNIKALELATDIHISSRQLERIFNENIGVTPKKMAALVRYQSLWRDICFQPNFQVQDAVCQYGYTDQAHLLNDFRKIHGLSIRDAKRYAGKNVEFLQDKM